MNFIVGGGKLTRAKKIRSMCVEISITSFTTERNKNALSHHILYTSPIIMNWENAFHDNFTASKSTLKEVTFANFRPNRESLFP